MGMIRDDNQWEGFGLADDLDTAYTQGHGATSASAFGPGRHESLHVWHWEVSGSSRAFLRARRS